MQSHIFFFHGNDSYSIAKKVAFWKTEFVRKYPTAPIHAIDLEQWQGSSKELKDSLHLFSYQQALFAEKKLIIIRHLFSHKEFRDTLGVELLDGLNRIDPDSIVVFVEHALDKRLSITKQIFALGEADGCVREEFVLLQGMELRRWIERFAHHLGVSFHARALDALMARFEAEEEVTDLWLISNEFGKLAAYAQGRAITESDIDLLMPRKQSGHVFDISAALLQGNRVQLSRVLSLMENTAKREDKSDVIGTCSFLSAQCHDFLIIKDMLTKKVSQQDIEKALNWKRERVFIVSRNITRVSLEMLISFTNILAALETTLKTSSANPRSLLTLALFQFISSHSSNRQSLA